MAVEATLLTEQMRRELGERMDVFLHDASRLVDKYAKDVSPAERLNAVTALAGVLAGQYAAELVAARLDRVAQETADASRSYLLASAQRGR